MNFSEASLALFLFNCTSLVSSSLSKFMTLNFFLIFFAFAICLFIFDLFPCRAENLDSTQQGEGPQSKAPTRLSESLRSAARVRSLKQKRQSESLRTQHREGPQSKEPTRVYAAPRGYTRLWSTLQRSNEYLRSIARVRSPKKQRRGQRGFEDLRSIARVRTPKNQRGSAVEYGRERESTQLGEGPQSEAATWLAILTAHATSLVNNNKININKTKLFSLQTVELLKKEIL